MSDVSKLRSASKQRLLEAFARLERAAATDEPPIIDTKIDANTDAFSTTQDAAPQLGASTGSTGNAANVLTEANQAPSTNLTRLVCEKGSSHKFYELELIGTNVHTRAGAIGTEGKPHVYELDTPGAAAKKFADLIRQKTSPAKGYVVDAAAPLAEASSGPNAITTLAQWDALDEDVRDQIIENGGDDAYGISGTGELELPKITDPELKAFAEKLRGALANDTGDFEVYDDDAHATVGEPEITVELATLADGTIVGGSVRAWQHGADHEDMIGGHFDSPAEAEAEGFDPGADVSWSSHGRYDHALKTLYEPESMQWMGY